MSDPTSTLSILLTPLEIFYLMDSVQVGDIELGNEDNPARINPIARGLILKLADPYNNIVSFLSRDEIKNLGDAPSETISVTLPEAWLLKSKVQSGSTGMGGVIIGCQLNVKILEVLQKFEISGSLGLGLHTAREVVDPSFGKKDKRALKRFNRLEGRKGKDENPDGSTAAK